MPARRVVVWTALFAALAAAGAGLPSCGREHRPVASEGTVVRVVDGDTIHVRIQGRREKVRYIGVDTPETGRSGTPRECFGRAASAFNARLVAGRRVRLRGDIESRDRYGRLLAYVYRAGDGLFVNAELVRRGFATILTIPPNVSHAAELLRLERGARQARRGLWSAC